MNRATSCADGLPFACVLPFMTQTHLKHLYRRSHCFWPPSEIIWHSLFLAFSSQHVVNHVCGRSNSDKNIRVGLASMSMWSLIGFELQSRPTVLL